MPRADRGAERMERGHPNPHAWLVTMAWGDVIVAGDIVAWLRANKAKSRKQGGYLIRGRKAFVRVMYRDVLQRIATIIPNGAAARALEAMDSRADHAQPPSVE